ncbi:MAG: TRAP transporter large permease [Nanoarchaeota archaeon]|nr:TRAP transporter large permease [Nanoarchaeota archaeon]
MEWYTSLGAMIGLFLFFILIGIPVNFALGLSFLPLMYFFSGEPFDYVFNLFGMITFRKLNSVVLVAVPLFILMGQLFSVTNVGFRMYEGFRRWLGWMPGGLAITTILTNTLFAAICGASLISAGTTGPVSIPSMVRHGYSRRLALGSECSGSALAMLIPPSIPGIFYCIITEQSIGRLFMAGMIPGLILAGLFIASILFRVHRNPALAPRGESAGWPEKIEALPWIGGPFVVVVFILFSLYSGLAGVNEMAAIGVCGAFVLAFVYREIDLPRLSMSLLKSGRFLGFFGMVFVCACFMGFGFTYYGISQAFSDWVGGLPLHRVNVLIIIMLMYLLLGMIMDASAIILVTMPVVLPIIEKLEYDPIWFGIMLILNLEIGAITPPVGVNLFALKSAIPDIDLRDAIFGSLPFLFMVIVVMVLMVLFPGLALWLPNQMIQ